MPVLPDDPKSSALARVDENDESVRIAVSALGDMRNATCAPTDCFCALSLT